MQINIKLCTYLIVIDVPAVLVKFMEKRRSRKEGLKKERIKTKGNFG